MKHLKVLMVAVAIFYAKGTLLQAQGLKDAYKDYFDIGVSIGVRNLTDEQKQLILENFGSITCENAMKPAEVHPREGIWTWKRADSIANFCRHHHIKMRGHCLVWHNQFSNWMFTDNEGKEVTKEVFYHRLREHIHAVINRYKDVVYCWDVVNEAMTDGYGDGKEELTPDDYRKSRLYNLCGDEFIAKAFLFAREADPDALLFYNDYNAAEPDKCDRIFNMVKKMKDNGIPIDGIGMQGHYNIYGPSMEKVENAIKKYATIVNTIHFTELDIRANEEMGGQLQFSRQGVGISDHVKELHTQQYTHLFRLFRKHKEVVKSVTFWNLSDRDSWIGADNYPLLIDKDLKYKSAYYIVRDFASDSDKATTNNF